MKKITAVVDQNRVVGRRDPMIYGQFLEHFHRQVYGGVYDPQSKFADESGLRQDVLEALKKLKIPVVRWPGGCFVSAYHWLGGVGPKREPYFDKAWCVEEPNTFGTHEYVDFCRKIGAEPYICTNAGTGTPEEMSDWVEYCNQTVGKFARLRKEHGHEEPYNVRYWSIGNENWGSWEMGSKSMDEWSRYVTEAAKMMRRADPEIQLFAASVAGLDWNVKLLREAGFLLNWVSIHGYWDILCEEDRPSDYERCMAATAKIEEPITTTESILNVLGVSDRVRIAFDEWNLRGWHHPGVMDFKLQNPDREDAAAQRDRNDLNSTYTMADAVFSAVFLNTCLRHCKTVGMANFSPIVNTRGAVYTYDGGIVLRPTYHVFDLFANHMGETVVDSYLRGDNQLSLEGQDLGAVDLAAALDCQGRVTLSLVNRHPEESLELSLCLREEAPGYGVLYTINGESKDSYNDVDRPEAVKITSREVSLGAPLVLEPHSVNLLVVGERK